MARFRMSQEAAAAGDYSKRADRVQILGMMHEAKRKYWEHLVGTCPGRTRFFEGPYDEVLEAKDIRLSNHPAGGNARQRAFLRSMAEVFTLVEAREAMPALSSQGVQKFVYRLEQRGLVEKVSRGRFRTTHLSPDHVCVLFEAILVERNVYLLTCKKCGRTLRAGPEVVAEDIPF